MTGDLPSTEHVDDLLRTLRQRVRSGDLAKLVRCGPFTLLHPIGRGGVGSVYAAVRDGETAPRFAVKVLDPGVDSEEMLVRFAREQRLLCAISHPGIIAVVGCGVQDTGQPWFAMPLVGGSAITREADAHELRIGDRLDLAAVACDALAATHAAGIIHRDIKPGNVIVSWHPSKPDLKLVDFGLARALFGDEPRVTPAGAVRRMGTPEYMSPEQWSDGIASCDARADVFSLGMLIAELASGVIARTPRVPARADCSPRTTPRRRARIAPAPPCAPSEALARLMHDDADAAQELARRRRLASADELLAAVRSRIDPLVAPMLARDPADRPPDARAAMPMVEATRRSL